MKYSVKDRLISPMIRVKGALRTASWDQALDCAADNFRQIKSKHGYQGFGMFSCSKTTNELNFLAQKFSRSVMGTNNIDSCNRT